jgi:hypothetical protein
MQVTFEKSCKGKHQYRTKKMAVEAMAVVDIENKTRLKWGVGNHKNMGKLNIYFCQFCGFWHIGHKER